MVKKRTKPPKGNKPYLIEHISSLDLGAWQRAATKIEKYHVQLFYHLAGQRALNAGEIQEALFRIENQELRSKTVGPNC